MESSTSSSPAWELANRAYGAQPKPDVKPSAPPRQRPAAAETAPGTPAAAIIPVLHPLTAAEINGALTAFFAEMEQHGLDADPVWFTPERQRSLAEVLGQGETVFCAPGANPPNSERARYKQNLQRLHPALQALHARLIEFQDEIRFRQQHQQAATNWLEAMIAANYPGTLPARPLRRARRREPAGGDRGPGTGPR